MKHESLIDLPQFAVDADSVTMLRTTLEAVSGPVALACSFSLEDIVLIDMLQNIKRRTGVFAIDTGRLNEETLELAERIRQRYDLDIHWYFPRHRAVERLEREKGPFSFRENLENRSQCCHIRKVEPLQRALKGLAGWITGQRRDHGVTRSDLQPVEVDQVNGGIIKLNPLCGWSDDQVSSYIEQRQLPVNRLYHQGYTSIGCAPCTRAVRAGEGPRSGRWWWENPDHKECGLHQR